ncbi:VWA domain-containing protein [Modestobacter sp. I12A-02628]|uniref:VWA domain-containing protein n=1 Tax=Goekera deserti TaxID=2497753 RepID=A0A7K3WEQ5_9ACTN|nr:VWA domain-containing protein [Goekera deserti]MPQ97993.1 VWA domain-containing protein [Goekera deserti]NDI48640.1 VWA domain-containing protein [Goekera deserti]NEL54981.1 VWA domain-containing protein [Goekera deserti]
MAQQAPSDEPAGLPLAALLTAAVLVVAVVLGVVVWQTRPARDEAAACAPQRVDVTVAPDLLAAVTAVFARPDTADPCVRAVVTAAEPADTVVDLRATRGARLPDVWVPDSAIWPTRVPAGLTAVTGTFATTPLVLGTSRAAADRLGWSTQPPTWAQALQGAEPVAYPDFDRSAAGVASLAALYTSMGGGVDADDAVIAAVLAGLRAGDSAIADAMAAARLGDPAAPVVPMTEQQVLATGSGSQLVAVYPADGSPRLEAPVVRVGEATSEGEGRAVERVLRALTSYAGQGAATTAGFRDVAGSAPPGAGSTGDVTTAEPAVFLLADPVVTGVLDELDKLARRTRLLAVVDSSASMAAPAGDGGTRATLARDAATNALALFPGSSSIGAWIFAYRLDGDVDHQVISPIVELDEEVGGQTQRDFLREQLQTLPDRLTPGGTALYDTTLAAVRASRDAFDPDAVNSVVVITDGRNEDREGITLPQLLGTLTAEADPARPIELILVGLGPDADLPALQQIAAATGGGAYSAVDPRDLESVLIDALRQRT